MVCREQQAPPPPPAFAEWKLTTPTRRASSASPVTHLDFLCHVAGGWTWPSAPGGCMWVLSSRTEGCQAQGLCGLRVCALSSGVCVGSLHLPLGTHRAFRRASSITAPLRAGIPHPTQPRPCNQSRSAGSLARAGSQVSAHRLGPVSLHTRAANNGRQSPRGARLPA